MVEAVNHLKVRSCLIDGEVCCCDERGLARFDVLRRRPNEVDAFLYAFDLLELDGTDLRREPLEVRKATLASILRQSRPGVRLNEHLAHDCGLTVFQHACQLGCEGIVSKKATVEGSLVLTASALVRKKALVPGAQTAGSWGWAYEGEDGPHATVRYEADLRDTDNAWLRLHYRADGEAVDYKVRLVTTKPNYGGHRWWFICPIVRRDGGPPRRVAKLYLPSGSKYFGSREAYALTYASCQESGK